jgi:16S rRNA (cytidine1402-2'-O)-methyltransferase
MGGTLYIVATPIGNLEDITLRALRVLKEVDLIAAEDTRHTHGLLQHFGIRTPLTSYHEHNERTKARQLVGRLKEGARIALVSDAGTPGISDPGYRLVVAAIEADIQIVPLPGASALTTILSVSGLPTDRFVFEGFLPGKQNERREKLKGLRTETRTLVFYEAPHRLKETLNDVQAIFGEREIVLAREVTKLHEEFLRGLTGELIRLLHDKEILGEMTLMIKGSSGENEISEDLLRAEIRALRAKGVRVKEIAELLGEKYSIAKRELYTMALQMEDRGKAG